MDEDENQESFHAPLGYTAANAHDSANVPGGTMSTPIQACAAAAALLIAQDALASGFVFRDRDEMRQYVRSPVARARAERGQPLSARTAPKAAQADVPCSIDLVSGELLPPLTIDVGRLPAAMRVKLAFQTDVSGLSSAWLTFRSPSGQQEKLIAYRTQAEPESGTIVIGYPQRFGFYSEPGTWTLDDVQLDNNADCSYGWGGDAIPGFANRSFEVINTHQPDFARPNIVKGTIRTGIVHRSAPHPVARIKLDVADDLSGVSYAGVCLSNIDPLAGGGGECFQTPSGQRPGLNTSLLAAERFWEGLPDGTYRVYAAFICDVGGSCKDYYDAAAAALFPDGTDIKLAP